MNNDTASTNLGARLTSLLTRQVLVTCKSDTMTYESLYIAAAKQHPNVQFAAYDAAQDSVQKRFLALSGQTDVDLLDAISANQADIRAEVSNFKSFITGGASHTVLARPEFYTYAANGVSAGDGSQHWRTISPLTMCAVWIVTRRLYRWAPLSGPIENGKAGRTRNSNTFSRFRFLTMSTMSASTG